MKQAMRLTTAPALTVLLAAALGLVGCGPAKTDLGEGGSVVSGSAGPAGAKNAARELQLCDAPVATLALAENPSGYLMAGAHALPSSVPTPSTTRWNLAGLGLLFVVR
mgnify:CR=1 FL=1